jgi:hypothetical protein
MKEVLTGRKEGIEGERRKERFDGIEGMKGIEETQGSN